MFPWDRELSSYDTIEKLQILARALELNCDDVDYIVNCIYDFQKRNPNHNSNLSVAEITQFAILQYRERIWNEMEVRREKRKLEKLIFGQTGCRSWFVTIGLDDNQFNDNNEAIIINPLVKKIISTPGFDNVKFVVEKFRRNDQGNIYIHRHIHLVFDCNMRKSKIIQFCFQKAKRYVAGQNFIDVKEDNGRSRDKYISGDKTQSKLECVAKDRMWRKEKNIIEN